MESYFAKVQADSISFGRFAMKSNFVLKLSETKFQFRYIVYPPETPREQIAAVQASSSHRL
jgi:hypothetical protein